MNRRKPSEPVAEDGEWMTTYAEAITLLMAFFVMLVNFLETDIPKCVKRWRASKIEMGMEKSPERPFFILAQSLDSILDNTNADPQGVEISFDDQGMAVEFASKSFSNRVS